MKTIAAGFFVVLTVAGAGGALAQSAGLGGIFNDALGGLLGRRDGQLQSWRGHFVQAKGTAMIVRAEDRKTDAVDILSGLPGEYRRLHGYRVHGSGSTMIVLADDGTMSAVDMSSAAGQAGYPIELGKAVTLAVKPGHEPNTFIAGRIEADRADPSTGKISRRLFDSVQGTVEAIQGSTIEFRTFEGTLLRADASRMPGVTTVQVNDRGALTYERWPKRQVTALWLERQEIQPSAAVDARLARRGEYQRIHGYVQSVK